MESLLCHCPCSRLASSFPRRDGAALGSSESTRADVKLRERIGSLRLRNGRRSSLGLVACQRTGEASAHEEQECKSAGGSHSIRRRQALFRGLGAALSLPLCIAPANAEPSDGGDMIQIMPTSTAVQVDEINAYSFVYPVAAGKELTPIKWVESRKPERYSSAAPLAPDARQRIVSERIDFRNNSVMSVSVGPPNFMILKSSETRDWDAKDVASSVLADKSTARMTTGQRVAEISILGSHSEEKDGIQYWYYEYIVQKSPTVLQGGLDVYRHSVAVTAEREGYLYSLNASTLDTNWKRMSPLFKSTISSFTLLPPTTEYVPPDKDPWRFW